MRNKTRYNIGVIALLTLTFMKLSYYSFSQTNSLPFEIKKTDFSPLQDSLKNLYGNYKSFIPKLELQALIALSHYPELNHVKIIFKQKKLNSTMAAKPTNISALRRIGKRTYLVHLNDYPKSVNIPFDSASFSAQVGVLGHELAHIAYYEKTSSWKLLGLAFKYLNKKFRIKFERDTDKRTINHNLGWQLYAFKLHVRNYPYAPEEYRDYLSRTYISAEEVEQLTLKYNENK
jgi:hypothetical protein